MKKLIILLIVPFLFACGGDEKKKKKKKKQTTEWSKRDVAKFYEVCPSHRIDCSCVLEYAQKDFEDYGEFEDEGEEWVEEIEEFCEIENDERRSEGDY